MSECSEGPILCLFQSGGIVLGGCDDVLGGVVHNIFVVTVLGVSMLWDILDGLQ